MSYATCYILFFGRYQAPCFSWDHPTLSNPIPPALQLRSLPPVSAE